MTIEINTTLGWRVRRVVADGRDVTRDSFAIDTFWMTIRSYCVDRTRSRGPVVHFLISMWPHLLVKRTKHRKIVVTWRDGTRSTFERAAA